MTSTPQQTDCTGASHYVDFSTGGWHPHTFEASEVTPSLVSGRLRGPSEACDAGAAIHSAEQLFTTSKSQQGTTGVGKVAGTHANADGSDGGSKKGEVGEERTERLLPVDWAERGGYKPLGPQCTLFARKFSSAAAEETLRMVTACEGAGVGLECRGRRGRRHA